MDRVTFPGADYSLRQGGKDVPIVEVLRRWLERRGLLKGKEGDPGL